MKKGYKQLLAEADAEVTAIEPAAAIDFPNREDLVLVDLRDPREREREGSIPGAFSCPRGMLEFWLDPESPYAKPIFAQPKRFVFFCASGWRSALAAKTAQDMGLEGVSHLAGGFSRWRESGGAVEVIQAKAPKAADPPR